MNLRSHVRSDRGQTATEYLMILGLTTAMILSLQVMVIPAIRAVVGACSSIWPPVSRLLVPGVFRDNCVQLE